MAVEWVVECCLRPLSGVEHFEILLAVVQICIGNKQTESWCIIVRYAYMFMGRM